MLLSVNQTSELTGRDRHGIRSALKICHLRPAIKARICTNRAKRYRSFMPWTIWRPRVPRRLAVRRRRTPCARKIYVIDLNRANNWQYLAATR